MQTLERHYSVQEIAEAWGVDPVTVRKIFKDEPGVLAIQKSGVGLTKGKRKQYTVLRIPESVLERVHLRLSNKGWAGPLPKRGNRSVE